MISDENYGICEYFNQSLTGFSGELKSRYSDFCVNEVDSNGNVVYLTDQSYSAPTVDAVDVSNIIELLKEKNILTKEQLDTLQEALESKSPISLNTLPINDKIERKNVHALFKGIDQADTSTNEDSSIKIDISNKKQKRNHWSLPNYCLFHLKKENRDTADAINQISKLLRISSKSFGYAGTKDKRAVTVQQVTVYRQFPERILELNKALKNIQVGNVQMVSEPLKLGSSSGNQFGIVLRNVTGDALEIKKCMKSLKENGFVNYFGLQRFGKGTTMEQGVLLLRGEWQKVVESILFPQNFNERPDILEGRNLYKSTMDAKLALEKFPFSCVAERSILLFFKNKQNNTDYLGAISAIPRNLRLMYLHAYQSFIWNKVLSARIKRSGRELQVGDLVMVDEKVVVIKTQKQANEYSIYDLVLALPGTDVMYPENESRQDYIDLMAADGLDPMQMARKQQDLSLSGDYRKCFVKPVNLEYATTFYKDETIPLIDDSGNFVENDFTSENKALMLKFTLGSSQYATMAIRELYSRSQLP